MTCKHRWIPIWERNTHAHYKCARCGNIINVILKGLE